MASPVDLVVKMDDDTREMLETLVYRCVILSKQVAELTRRLDSQDGAIQVQAHLEGDLGDFPEDADVEFDTESPQSMGWVGDDGLP
jgi:hypothetical protein